jgi:patatin-like phospholipase/acyl hydrolase
MAVYRILSLDGGGIRGVLTASILERIEKTQPGFMAKFDLFAGTSTGGILALALAAGYTPTEARLLYEELGAQVFKDSRWDNFFDVNIPGLGPLRGAQYSNVPLKSVVEKKFGSLKLKDLPKKVLISSFDLDNESKDPAKPRSWKPKFFHNYPGPDSDGEELVVDTALYTSAAPTFFPVYHGYIDGGVIANNPSLCALAQAMSEKGANQPLRSLRLLSVGTGYNPQYMQGKDEDWGLIQWAPHLVSLMLEGSQGTAEYQCRQILGKHFRRINPVLPVPIGLDGLAQVEMMKQIAYQADIAEAESWVKSYFRAA